MENITFYIITLSILIVISYLLSLEGTKRKIGGKQSFWISFFFSPIIGLIFVLNSKLLDEKEQINRLNQKVDFIPFVFITFIITILLIFIITVL
mgnify:CR=1 FL=1